MSLSYCESKQIFIEGKSSATQSIFVFHLLYLTSAALKRFRSQTFVQYYTISLLGAVR